MARNLRKDAVAGFPVLLSRIPGGMAGGLLAGVNPIHGLYAAIFPPVVGGLAARVQLLVISSTSASTLTGGQGLAAHPEDQRTAACPC